MPALVFVGLSRGLADLMRCECGALYVRDETVSHALGRPIPVTTWRCTNRKAHPRYQYKYAPSVGAR